tara:strand:- start:874 stop:1164 length:291 start_codon:yes stop_codon:yes gene_type:complete
MAFKMKGLNFGEGTGSSPFEEVSFRGGKRYASGKWGTFSREVKTKDKKEKKKKKIISMNFDIRDIFPKIDPNDEGTSLVTQPHIKASGFAKNKPKN